jgi:hypothetical protein
MRGLPNTLLIVLLINMAASSGAFARARPLPAGPEWYADDNGLWRSLRDDWRGLQGANVKHRSLHRHSPPRHRG